MKLLLFAAFALSLMLVVSAQCNLSAATTCTQNFVNMVRNQVRLTALAACMQILCMQLLSVQFLARSLIAIILKFLATSTY
jgi:cell division protein FtsW (lipid II flippase)